MAKTQEQQSGEQSSMGFLKEFSGPMGKINDLNKNLQTSASDHAKNLIEDKAKMIAKKAAKKIASKILTNPYVLAAIGIVIVVVVVFLIIIGAISGQSNPSTSGVSPQPAPPPSVVYTFVALGDSLTAWPCDPVTFGCVDSNPWGSYRFAGKPWPTYLTTDNPNLKLLYNAGYPAQTTAYMLTQEPEVLSAHKPDVLFVLGGTNDLLNGGISEQQTIANLKSIITTAQSSTYGVKKVIVLTIPNQCNGYNKALNADIKGLSTLAPVIDISSTSSLTLDCASDVQTSDNLHLTDAGAKKVADYIDAQIKAQNIFSTPVTKAKQAVYCQWGEVWSSQLYDSGNVGSVGCAPTSMAMILSSYGGTNYDPGQVATMFEANGIVWPQKSGYRGSNPWMVTGAWLNSIGFQRAQADIVNNYQDTVYLDITQLKAIKNYTDAGWLMMAAVDGHNLPTKVPGGHEVVIESADPIANTVTIRDPNSPNCLSGKTVTIDVTNIGWNLITPVKIK